MGILTHRCEWCGILNALPDDVGDRRLRCGKCKGPLPTPRILSILVDIHRQLQAISADSASPSWNADRLRPRLEKQKLRMAHAEAHFRGFSSTVSASMDLVVDMQLAVREIEIRLQRRGILEAALRTVLEMISRLLRIQIQLALPLPTTSR